MNFRLYNSVGRTTKKTCFYIYNYLFAEHKSQALVPELQQIKKKRSAAKSNLDDEFDDFDGSLENLDVVEHI